MIVLGGIVVLELVSCSLVDVLRKFFRFFVVNYVFNEKKMKWGKYILFFYFEMDSFFFVFGCKWEKKKNRILLVSLIFFKWFSVKV